MVAIDKKSIVCFGLLAVAFAPSVGAEETGGITVEGSVAFVTDYRFRGVSLSDKDGAVQAGLTVTGSSGLYGSVWGSSIESFNGAETETDFVIGYGGKTDSGLSYDVGALLYAYPGGAGTDYYEFYGSLSKDFEQFSASAGMAYNPSQANIGGQDNIYIFTDVGYEVVDTPFGLTGHFGYEDGAFGDNKLDWALGVSAAYEGLEFGVSYVDTNLKASGGKGGVMLSIGAAF